MRHALQKLDVPGDECEMFLVYADQHDGDHVEKAEVADLDIALISQKLYPIYIPHAIEHYCPISTDS